MGAYYLTPPVDGGAFITKLNATGSALIYSSYLPGVGGHVGGIAIDAAGYAYVTGWANSAFATTPTAYWPTNSNQSCSGADVFVTKLNQEGSQLVYSTCLNASVGESYTYFPPVIAVDGTGKAFITGPIFGSIPTTSGAYQTSNPGGVPAFASAVDTTASGAASLVYSTYIGNTSSTHARPSGIAVDSFGKFYVTGYTYPGFPTTPGAFQPNHAACSANGGGSCLDAFIAKFDPSSSGSQSLIYSTYLGGTGDDFAESIAIDASGNAYVTGWIQDYNNSDFGTFPTTPGAFQKSDLGSFVTKLNAGGSKLLYSTYLASATPTGIAVDSSGDAYVVGSTSSAFFPVTIDAFQSTHAGGQDAFLAGLDPVGSGLVYSTYLGGPLDDEAAGIAVDQTGDIYLAGWTASPTFPVTAGAFQPRIAPTPSNPNYYVFAEDVFITKFPSGSTFRLQQILPNAGGNAGNLTATISGVGFHSGATAQLNCGGGPVVGTTPTVGPGGRFLSTTFNLTATAPGTCDVVITNPGSTSATLSQAFTVQQGGAPNIQIQLTGAEVRKAPPEVPLAPANAVVFATVSNTGNIDSDGVFIWELIPAPFSLTSVSPVGVANLATLTASSEAAWSASLTAGSSQVFTFTATTTTDSSSVTSDFTANACVMQDFEKQAYAFCMQRAACALCSRAGCPCEGAVAALYSKMCNDCGLASMACSDGYSDCDSLTAQCQADIAGFAKVEDANPTSLPGCQVPDIVDNCEPGKCKKSPILKSSPSDPNSLVGPSGVGSQLWISDVQGLTYGISFGNESTAAVPAQQVVVTEPLGANVNLSTLQLPNVTIPNGSSNVQVPIPGASFDPAAGVNEFTTNVDLRPTQSLLVNVDAKLNPATQTLTWTFTSIDPTTGLPPLNPLVGFLPPGAGANVSFSATPTPDLATGSQVTQQATIIFQGASPMITAAWTNTIDNTPPVSAVSTLAATQTTSCFRPQWAATDVGSGVQGTTIFVSDTGGAYARWLTNTTSASAIYNGVAGHTYAFYSQATDLVGNVEATRPSPDTSTTVPAGASCNGRPTIAGSVASNSLSGTTETLTLQLTNNGVGNAQNINITSVSLRTLVGTGAVTLSSPATPISVGSLAAGASTTEALTLNAPATVREYSITEAGTVQDAAGNTYSFSIAEAVIP